MPGPSQSPDGRTEILLFKENVVGQVSRHDQDADMGVPEGECERGKDAHLAEIQRPLHSQAAPTLFRNHPLWKSVLGADQGEFLTRAGHRPEWTFRRPFRDSLQRVEAANRKAIRKNR